MLHWLIVGHIDPGDSIDLSERPAKPKILRPIAVDVVEQFLDEFGREVEPFITCDEYGAVYCAWAQAPQSLSNRIMEFASLLAKRQGAVVMTEMLLILEPTEAQEIQRLSWEKLS